MKKLFNYVLPLFASAVLLLSLSACANTIDSVGKNYVNGNKTFSFVTLKEWKLTETTTTQKDGKQVTTTKELKKGLYTIEGKNITLKMEGVKDPLKYTFDDDKQTKIKDKDGGIWILKK